MGTQWTGLSKLPRFKHVNTTIWNMSFYSLIFLLYLLMCSIPWSFFCICWCVLFLDLFSVFVNVFSPLKRWTAFIQCKTLIIYIYKQFYKNYERCSKRTVKILVITQISLCHALNVVPMNSLPECVTVRWFRYTDKLLVYGRSKPLSGAISPPSEEDIQKHHFTIVTRDTVWWIRRVW